jgi:pimeloyl-ACP methyl ester carboxylesterase
LVTTALAVVTIASSASAQFSPDAKKTWADYETLAPHKVFMLAPNGKGYLWAGAPGADPSGAVERGLKSCESQANARCTLYAVNNVVLNGRDWKSAAPVALSAIGRLRAEPFWENKGPTVASGLIVWSHGYFRGIDATNSAPQGQIAYFTRAGYDLYRFDRQWIRSVQEDASDFAAALQQAKSLGYRRVILAGQSNGAWTSLETALRSPAVDGVISISAAHHGEVKDMRDVSIARADWQKLMKSLKPGPRIMIFIFKGDSYDVGGRTDDAIAAFKASGVDSIVVAYPADFTGHGAANANAFPRKFGACIYDFIEQGLRKAPCI